MEKNFRKAPELVAGFKKLDTTCVADALDRFGFNGCLEGIKPINPGLTMCGQAYTVRYVPAGTVAGVGVGDFLEDVEPGEVVVIDNGGRMNMTVWGDLMAVSASAKGLAGTVIDGVCRDVPTIKRLNYPIFTKGYYMRTGKDRVELVAINQPVEISNVLVEPGDIILADDTGAVVVPLGSAAEVLTAAQGIAEKEELILSEMAKGKTLKEARAMVNYHHLQSRQK